MIILSYDISDDKLRRHFAKYIGKFGHRIQYSVFELNNSETVLKNIITNIDNKFGDRFSESDSVVIFKVLHDNDIIKYGFNKHDDDSILII